MKPTAEEFSHGASLLDCLLLAIPLPHPTTPHCVMGLFLFGENQSFAVVASQSSCSAGDSRLKPSPVRGKFA
jgi:hypothetical protein